jgi:hypothetical protein
MRRSLLAVAGCGATREGPETLEEPMEEPTGDRRVFVQIVVREGKALGYQMTPVERDRLLEAFTDYVNEVSKTRAGVYEVYAHSNDTEGHKLALDFREVRYLL